MCNHGFVNESSCDTRRSPVDLLCQAINRVCQTAPIKKLVLFEGFLLSKELFSFYAGQATLWPRIQTIHISSASTFNVHGGWFTRGNGTEGPPRGYGPLGLNSRNRDFLNGLVPDHEFRKYIDGGAFDPLLRSMLAGMAKMPALERAWVSFEDILPAVEYHLLTPPEPLPERYTSWASFDEEEGAIEAPANSLLGLTSLRIHRHRFQIEKDSWKTPEDVAAGCRDWMDMKDGVFKESFYPRHGWYEIKMDDAIW